MTQDRWVIAVRVSTEQQEVAQQLDALQDAAKRHGALVVEVVRIEGISAWDRKTSRKVEEMMLAPIAAGRADTLAVWRLDRVTRQNIKDTLAFFDRLEKHLGGKLFSLTEPIISTATMVPETRDLFVSLFAFLANRESNTKSERVKAKVVTKRNRAAVLGAAAKWGKGKLATAEQVRAMLASTGPVRAVADEVGTSKSVVDRIRRDRARWTEWLAKQDAKTVVPGGPLGQDGGPTDGQAPLEAPRLGQAGMSDAAGATGPGGGT